MPVDFVLLYPTHHSSSASQLEQPRAGYGPCLCLITQYESICVAPDEALLLSTIICSKCKWVPLSACIRVKLYDWQNMISLKSHVVSPISHITHCISKCTPIGLRFKPIEKLSTSCRSSGYVNRRSRIGIWFLCRSVVHLHHWRIVVVAHEHQNGINLIYKSLIWGLPDISEYCW